MNWNDTILPLSVVAAILWTSLFWWIKSDYDRGLYRKNPAKQSAVYPSWWNEPRAFITPNSRERPFPGLYCPHCGKQGATVQVKEKVPTKAGKLDLPYYLCHNCRSRWYDHSDITGFVVTYLFERSSSI